MSQALLLITTLPSAEEAESLAAELVERRLAAGVNVVPGVRSFYRWRGEARRADESLLLVKTLADAYEEVERTIRELHPYEVPQVLALEVDRGSDDYLKWIVESMARP